MTSRVKMEPVRFIFDEFTVPGTIDPENFNLRFQGKPSGTPKGIDILTAEKLSGHNIIDADNNSEVSTGDWIVDNTGKAVDQFDDSYFDPKDVGKLEAFLSQGDSNVQVICGESQSFLVVSLKNAGKSFGDFESMGRFISDARKIDYSTLTHDRVSVAPRLTTIYEIGVAGWDLTHSPTDLEVVSQVKIDDVNRNIVASEGDDTTKAKHLSNLETLEATQEKAMAAGKAVEEVLQNGKHLNFDVVQTLLTSLSVCHEAESRIPYNYFLDYLPILNINFDDDLRIKKSLIEFRFFRLFYG